MHYWDQKGMKIFSDMILVETNDGRMISLGTFQPVERGLHWLWWCLASSLQGVKFLSSRGYKEHTYNFCHVLFLHVDVCLHGDTSGI